MQKIIYFIAMLTTGQPTGITAAGINAGGITAAGITAAQF